jgi:hypothetical protein
MSNAFQFSFISLLLALQVCAAGAFAQPAAAKNAETRAEKVEGYQNQQRAASLSNLRPDIKLVDDAPQRCFLRIQIAKFIFESKTANYYDTANSLAVECLDETIDNADQFSDSQLTWTKGNILSLLRKYSPQTAVKIEKKYFAETGDTDFADESEALNSKDPNQTANRIIAKIDKGEAIQNVFFAVGALRKQDPNAAFRILEAALDYYEANFDKILSDPGLVFLTYEFLADSTPIALKNRFYILLVRIGESAIADPANFMLTSLAVTNLESAMPDIKKVYPELFSRAFSLYTALSSKKSGSETESDEVYERIKNSKDKLAQTISEAESAKDKNLKNELWQSASDYAFEEKKFRLSADTRLKIEHDRKNIGYSQSYFLIEILVEASLKEKDIESAEYIAGLVEEPDMKGRGLIKIAAKLVELKKRDAAFDKLNDGLKILEKADLTSNKIWIMLYVALPVALKIDKTRAFDIAGDAVKTINRFPTPGPDDKPGTEARKKYADTLTAVSYNLTSAFRLLGKEDMALAYPVSQGIQIRDWRLATQIALETQRTYPLPPEMLPPVVPVTEVKTSAKAQ